MDSVHFGVHYHRDLDVPYFRRLRYAFGTVADHNRGEMIFGSLELMEWPVMHDLVARRTCALRCILSRGTPIAEGNPYLSQYGIQFHKHLTVLIVDQYVEREMQAFC